MIHYGMFTLVHGIFVFELFIKDLVFGSWMVVSTLFLFISHGISMISNYLGKKEYEQMSLMELMFAPYKRIVIMHITIIFTGFLSLITNQNVVALLLLIVLKTLSDFASHLLEHAQKNTYVMKPWAQKITYSIFPNFETVVEKAYREAIDSGKFEQFSKDMDPNTVAYIYKYFSTPKDQRHNLKPPEPLLASAKTPDFQTTSSIKS